MSTLELAPKTSGHCKLKRGGLISDFNNSSDSEKGEALHYAQAGHAFCRRGTRPRPLWGLAEMSLIALSNGKAAAWPRKASGPLIENPSMNGAEVLDLMPGYVHEPSEAASNK